MSKVTIRVYRVDGGAGNHERQLIRTVYLESTSSKRLTAKRATQILKRECAELEGQVIVIKTDEGWRATRSLKPIEKCPYFYIWIEAVITED